MEGRRHGLTAWEGSPPGRCGISPRPSLPPSAPSGGHPPRVGSPGMKAEEGTPALPKYVYKQKQDRLVRLKMKPGTGDWSFLEAALEGWGRGEAGHHFAALINDAVN